MKTKVKEHKAPETEAGLFADPEVLPPAPPARQSRKIAIQTPSAPISETEQMIAMFERAIRDPAVDVAKSREIMAMRKELAAERAQHVFNEAMASAQADIGMVVVDRNNPQTKSRYASYPALDKAIRPIYSKHRFALSFDTEEGAPPDYIRVVCFVSCAGHTRKYRIDMPADGKGAKGGDVMTKTHATGSGVSYGMRYLLKMIFNIATGEDDDDGNRASAKQKIGEPMTEEEVTQIIELCAAELLDEARLMRRMNETRPKGHPEAAKVTDLPRARFKDVVNTIAGYGANRREREAQKASQDDWVKRQQAKQSLTGAQL